MSGDLASAWEAGRSRGRLVASACDQVGHMADLMLFDYVGMLHWARRVGLADGRFMGERFPTFFHGKAVENFWLNYNLLTGRRT